MSRPKNKVNENPVGERIQERRRELNMNQQELAEQVDVTQIQVSKYENGVNYPSLDTLILLAQALNTTADYLLGLTDNPYPESPTQSIPPELIDLLRDRDEEFYRLLAALIQRMQ